MDINNILSHPAINTTEIARRLYPNLSANSAKSKLAMKMSGAQGRRISEEEQNRIFQIWTNIKEEIHKPMIQERVS